jgi:internalin A
MPTEPTRRPWWRYIRLSLRGLIVIVLVIGGSLGWVVHSARVQREAVAAIEKAGGTVLYVWGRSRHSTPPPPGTLRLEPWAPTWLVKLVGVDYFDRVVQVALNKEDSSAALPYIRDLPHIRFLSLEAPCVTNVDLEYLEGLHELELLSLNDNVTDAGMKHLKGLSSLGKLYLGGTRISDAGLAELEPLHRLWYLSLPETDVSDAGLAHLKKLAGLRHLNLCGTRVTDAGIRDLQQARPSLEIIR